VQIGWCKKSSVPRAIITHCGTQIVTAHKPALGNRSVSEPQYGLRVEVLPTTELALRHRPRGVGPARR
jgi:hypothetical protein